MREMQKFLLIFLIYFFIGISTVYAVSVTIDPLSFPISTEPFDLTVTVSGAKTGINYLRADIYKEGTTDYFGETFNGTDWYGAEDATHYFPIDTITDTPTIATISARLSPIPAGWSGSDNFFVRVRRYTASGNYTGTEAVASAIPISIIIPTPTPTQAPTPTPPISPSLSPYPPISQTPTPISNIYISELMPFPDNSNEWVELYNNNDFEVSLNAWFIDDGADSGSSPKVFSITIPSKAYRVVELSTAIFNNSGDTVRLLDASSNEKDRITYTLTKKVESIGRNDILSNTTCIQVPSYERSNNPCSLAESNISEEEDDGEVFGVDEEIVPETHSINEIPLSSASYSESSPHVSSSTRSRDSNDVSSAKDVLQVQKSNSFDILIKTGTTSAFLISLLNISFILCKMVIRPYD